jgi:hypothetical protein
MFHQNLWSNLHIGFPSRVLESVVLPTWVDLFLQRKDYEGQAMGGHIDSCQALLFQVVDFVSQSGYLREFEWGGLFTTSSLELGESAYKGREARFVVLTKKTRSYAIPGEKSSEDGRGSQHEGGFEDLHPQYPFC